MIKTNKNKGLIFQLIKLIALVALVWLCYNRFHQIPLGNPPSFQSIKWWPCILALLLVVLNYFFEFKKWQVTLNQSNTTLSKNEEIQSFFAGIITGMLTPNMQGNFIGRIYYTPRIKRVSITLLTLVGNFGQFITTIFMGIIALFLYQKLTLQLWIPTLIVILGFLIYFNFEKVDFFKRKWKWYKRLNYVLMEDHSFRWIILCLSFLRNLVFSFQFLLVLHAFGADFSWETFLLIWTVYLYTTLSPSLFLGKLVVRESIAVLVLAPLGLPVWNIVFASLLIWVINLLLPTLTGLFICKRIDK